MHPVNARSVSGLIKDMQDPSRPHQARLMSAQFAMAASVAMRMELAGTGSAGTPPGGISPHPPELFQFTHNGRDYFFERGEFPVWDEVKDLRDGARAKRNRGEELEVRESLYPEVQELAEQVLASIEDYSHRDD